MAKANRICTINDCGKRHYSLGLCQMHYVRVRKYGSPDIVRPKVAEDRAEKIAWIDEAAKGTSEECVIWPWSRDDYGYGYLTHSGKNHRIHRIMCEKVHGTPEDAARLVRHTCGNGHLGCANPHHLAWGTVAQNSVDMIEHGKSTRGQQNAMSKLNEDDIIEIRNLCRSGEKSQRAIAKMFGVHQSAISKIINFNRWGWVHA